MYKGAQNLLLSDEMRLTTAEVEMSLTCAKRYFGESCTVRLFGSRTDDSKRGGDIDLHIEAGSPDVATLHNELKFRQELKEHLGEQQVDVIVRAPHYTSRAINIIAVETGLVL
jgi:predicted nucleotidyltransferase